MIQIDMTKITMILGDNCLLASCDDVFVFPRFIKSPHSKSSPYTNILRQEKPRLMLKPSDFPRCSEEIHVHLQSAKNIPGKSPSTINRAMHVAS